MSNLICPKCGAVAKGGSGLWRYSKPYCTVCGWNLEQAKEKELRNLKALPIALLWTAGAIGAMGYFYGASRQFIVYAFFCVSCLAIAALASWRRWKTMQGSRSAETSARPFVNAAPARYPATTSSEAAVKSRAIHDRLLVLPKPRRTKLKSDPVVMSIALVAIALTFLMVAVVTTSKSPANARTRNNPSNTPLLSIFSLALLGCAGITIRDLMRDRRLLANGDVALAVITRQRIAGGYRQTKIS
jgi:hypothetical protein